MCGIAGIFHNDADQPVDSALVTEMAEALRHRGPDGDGAWLAPGIGLGHRRLAIVDPHGSHQPMVGQSGRLVISFNGEIYNFRELRAELEALGHRFERDGDTEVLLAAWEQWGTACLSRLNGMFAFALYDRSARSLHLVRDRVGVKPLFMASLYDGTVIFASELKALLTHPQLERRLDPLAIEDFMTWGFVPDCRSILKGVRKLPAGHFLHLRHGAPLPSPTRWWDVQFAERRPQAPGLLSEELHDLVRSAVRSRMVADVPLGAFLSGGVDSSSVVAMMAQNNAKPVKTYTIGFDNPSLDESHFAATVAKLFQTDHQSRYLRLSAAQNGDDFAESSAQPLFHHADAMARIYDEPFADASALPMLAVCELASGGVKVALSGDGADEAFGGYRRHIFHHHEDRIRQKLPPFVTRFGIRPLARYYPKADYLPQIFRAKSVFQSLGHSAEGAYAAALSVSSHLQRSALYTPNFAQEIDCYRGEGKLLEILGNAPGRTALDKVQYADITFALPAGILTKVDRASMACGLEVREPMLDYRLVEFGATLPANQRVNGTQGKYLLKKAMQGYFPPEFLQRKKLGFVSPISYWLKAANPRHLEHHLSGSIMDQAGWFSGAFQRKLIRDHHNGSANHSRVLWQLLTLNAAIRNLSATG